MPYLSPPTLTQSEQSAILQATRQSFRDHLIISMALGTGLRLGEIVDLDVGDVYQPDGTPRIRVHLRPAIAKGGRSADVFLPDALVAKLKRFRRYKQQRRESLDLLAPLFCSQSRWRISKRPYVFPPPEQGSADIPAPWKRGNADVPTDCRSAEFLGPTRTRAMGRFCGG